MSIDKLRNAKQDMKRLNDNILGVCETWWKGAGITISNNYKIINSCGENQHRGVAIVIDLGRSKSMNGYWTVSDRRLLVKLSTFSCLQNLIAPPILSP